MSFTGPNDALQIFGVTLIGVTPEDGRKLLLTLMGDPLEEGRYGPASPARTQLAIK